MLPYAISAQVNPDSVPAGVIVVQRPSIKATYRVQLDVLYEDPKADHKRITEISPNQIVFSDSGFSMQPHPLLEYLFNDSLHTRPSEEMILNKQFDWAYYLSRVPYEFKWADSTRADSVRFIYNVDKNGNATCNPLPWPVMDSSNTALQTKVGSHMARLRQWSAASKAKTSLHFFTREKSVACIVLITIWAYDPYAGRLMPIEVTGK
jgi:hypothetical protein